MTHVIGLVKEHSPFLCTIGAPIFFYGGPSAHADGERRGARSNQGAASGKVAVRGVFGPAVITNML